MINRKKTKQKSTNNNKYNIKLAVLGLVIIFMSLIALFNWGFIGVLYTNFFRLFVGESYPLLLIVSIYIGIRMIISGRVFNFTYKGIFGTLLIFAAITTAMHYNTFFPQEPLVEDIISTTYDLFRNEFITGQQRVSLGGGMLGAVFYKSFGYLFGRWGTYLLSFLLFMIGLFMVEDFSLKQLKLAFLDIFHFFRAIPNKFNKQFETIKSVSEVDNEVIDKSVTESNSNENYEYIEQTHQSYFDKIKNKFKFDNNTQDNENNFYDIKSDYQPSINISRKEEWDNFNYNDPIATTAKNARNSIDEKILDLDYFDEINIVESETKIEDSSVINIENNNDLLLKQTEKYQEVIKIESEIEEIENNLDNQAGHWHEKANITQRLTDDEVENTLSNSKEEKVSITKNNKKSSQYVLPGKDLLIKRPPVDQSSEYKKINQNIKKLEQTFQSFGVDAKIVKANLGPAVTKYEIEPAVGVKVSKIVSLTDDIALALAARDIRMEAPIPGKSLIGIEVPNSQISPVSFSEIVDAALNSDKILEVPLGRDVSGSISTADLSKMPHLLIAGSTGSGKSVGMNVIICSLLMKAKPEEVKFLMIDPKKVELTMYNEIPHLLSPVVTNPRKAAKALNQVVEEMEQRYEKFAEVNVRNQESYNEYIDKINQKEGTGYEKMPKIVVFIDELADLMLVAGNEVENSIIRLAQMARAAGIHMIIATQRPSVDVITGIIKANIPSRLAFAVTSGTDSRTILDSNGAEKLLGKGDMLFQPISMNKPVRVQGAYISDEEVERITNFIKEQRSAEYDESMIITDEKLSEVESSEDEYFEDAVELIKDQDTVSISQLQRKFRIGYNRAARLIDDLEALGYIGPADGSKPRQVYINE